MVTNRQDNREQLQSLLRDLFQFDASDLDFGVYRILNQRRDQIDQFIEEDLLDAVEEGLSDLAEAKRGDIEAELKAQAEEVRDNVSEDAINPDGSINDQYAGLNIQAIEEYQRKREELEQVEVSEETEARVLNDLYRFFSRYYDDGDFHTKRRISSKDAKYAVPYNGEEVHFHWANRNQYYVKTGQHFTDYRFTAGDYDVEFRLEEANVPQDNLKDESRYFVLGAEGPVSYNSGDETLSIHLQYRKITEEEADDYVDAYNEAAGEDRDPSYFSYMSIEMRCAALESRILQHIDNEGVESELTEEADSKTHLKKHLIRYVSENTRDYFVHKDLEEFLRGELDHFLKNEVVNIDDLLQTDNPDSPEVLRARTVRTIAERIITFLAQIEDFQKRLFEKRKFVTQTDYMVTLDHVPERLYGDILENQSQIDQWEDVYNTEDWDTDLYWRGEFDESFLQNHESVMVDTGHFDESFKQELLSSIDDLEEVTDGVLINSENFQALNLLSEKLNNKVDCCYIDPPYNTGNDGFLYKDNFRHSSWLSLMRDRLELVQDIFSDDSSIFISNDDNENNRLNLLMNQIFGSQNFVAEVIWQKVYSPKNSAKYFSEDHDYITAYAKNKENWRPNRLPRSEEQNERYQNPDDDERGPWKPSDLTARNPYSKGQYEVESPSGKTFSPPTGRYWSISKEKFEELDADNRIWWGEDGTNMPHLKRFLSEVEDMVPQTLWEYDEVGHTQNAKKELLTFVDFERTEDVLNSVKPSSLLERILRIGTDDEGTEWVLDFFAGSGPTAHAAINLNREEGSDRRYVLVEMSDYFDTMIRPRIQRLVFSSEWKDGVPEENDGVSHLIKYQRLESYEDALNNIRLETPDTPQQQLFEEDMEDYVEGYMLDFEAEESASLLPEETFSDPFSHELEIEENGASREPTDVDLVETFHYLIGADVRKYWHDEHKERKYVITECDVQTDSGVEQILTVWRPTADLSLDDEADWFDDEYDSESYDRVYVNGESYIAQSEPLEITFREEMEGSPNVS